MDSEKVSLELLKIRATGAIATAQAELNYIEEQLELFENESAKAGPKKETKNATPKSEKGKTKKQAEVEEELMDDDDGEVSSDESDEVESDDADLEDALGEPEEIISADDLRRKATEVSKAKGAKGKELVRKVLAKYSKGGSGQVKDIPVNKYAETLNALNKLK